MQFGYTRVSTDKQDEGFSPEKQADIIRGCCMMRGSRREVSFFRDVVSGSVPLAERRNGSRMLAQLEAGDVVIAAKLDRLFRSSRDALNMVGSLQDKKIDVILCDISPEPVTKAGTGHLFFTILAAIAQFERERIAERTNEGKRAKRREQGFCGGHAPYGFAVEGHGKDAKLVPFPAEQEVIAQVRALAPSYSLTNLVAHLSERGIVARSGRPFHPFALARMLNDARVDA